MREKQRENNILDCTEMLIQKTTDRKPKEYNGETITKNINKKAGVDPLINRNKIKIEKRE